MAIGKHMLIFHRKKTLSASFSTHVQSAVELICTLLPLLAKGCLTETRAWLESVY